jgi:hypothetical protein
MAAYEEIPMAAVTRATTERPDSIPTPSVPLHEPRSAERSTDRAASREPIR